MVVAKFLCHATAHTNFLEKKTLKEKKEKKVWQSVSLEVSQSCNLSGSQ